MRIVPAGNGWKWLKQGWALFVKAPAEWLMLMMLFLIVSAVINWIPWIGPFIASALIPCLSAGLMQACAEAHAGRSVQPAMLFAPLTSKPAALIRIGVLYLVWMLISLAVTYPIDDGALFNQMLLGTPPPAEAIKDGSLPNALALAGLLASPVLMALWFAPMLILWRDLGVSQSLFYSFFASLRNWRVFGIYCLIVFGGVMTASLAIALAGVSAGVGLGVMRAMMLGLVLLMMPTVTCSFYFSYVDIFPPAESEPTTTVTAESDSSQD